MSNSKLSPLAISKHPVSPKCYAMWPGMQDPTDGLVTIMDRSGNGRHLAIGASGSYAAVTGASTYASIVGTANGVDKALTNSEVIQYNIASGQSIIIAFAMNAAAPGVVQTVCGFRGVSGDFKGVAVNVDAAGKPSVAIRDTGITYNTPLPTNVVTDGTDHFVIVAIDGTNKKVLGWDNGSLWSNMGSGQSGFGSGSTQPDGPFVWGGTGDFVSGGVPTWVNGQTLKLRNMHVYVLPAWPSNISGIVAELTRNQNRPLSKFILP